MTFAWFFSIIELPQSEINTYETVYELFDSIITTTTVKIPDTVLIISTNAFNSPNLESVTFENDNPPMIIGGAIFAKDDTDLIVYVSSGQVSAYKAISAFSDVTVKEK